MATKHSKDCASYGEMMGVNTNINSGESPFSFKLSYCKIICRDSNSNSEASLLTVHYDQAHTYQYRKVSHRKFIPTFELSYNTTFHEPNKNSSIL
jgi:hypothetical protein